jgi:hypothetical protein
MSYLLIYGRYIPPLVMVHFEFEFTKWGRDAGKQKDPSQSDYSSAHAKNCMMFKCSTSL